MEYPIKIKARDGHVVRALRSGGHEIEVREDGGLRWMHFGDDAIQAMMVINDPARPIIPYQVYMLAVLLFNRAPNFMLNLGVGCGSFERFFAEYFPELQLTSVESNPDVICLLQDHFALAARRPIINLEAGAYLSGCTTSYDLILCDLFDHSGHPPCVYDSDFHADVLRCLSSDGVFAINLLPETEAEMVDILLAVRSSFEHVMLLDIPYYKNFLLFCLRQAAPDMVLLELRGQRLFATTGLDMRDVTDLLTPLPKRQV